MSNWPLFDSPEHYSLVIDVVRENPKRGGEGLFAYLDRIATEAALIRAGQGLLGKGALKSERREPGQDG